MPFDYRVVAKRADFEEKRLEVCAEARNDPYLYPELREKLLRGYEQERIRMEQERGRTHEGRDRMADAAVRPQR